MIKTINGSCFLELMEAGVKNLEKNRKRLNDLNVFPVPDGDTGTNMVMTLRAGVNAAKRDESLSETASKIAQSALFGARGNSGVIISQFFKGVALGLDGCEQADAERFVYALKRGVELAYVAVAKPVEGTMLTVLREATHHVYTQSPCEDIDTVVEGLVKKAKESLQKTPDLLPILKKAGVVDSGAYGVVCIFEGMLMQLTGREIDSDDDLIHVSEESIDPSRFNKNTPFKHGYCVEGIIQLTVDERDFSYEAFKRELCSIGNSLVSSLEGDKVKLHIHVMSLGELFNYCHQFGEFLTVKIENMSVQQIINEAPVNEAPTPERFLCAQQGEGAEFAIVAVATTPEMQLLFSEMGADVVILSEIAPSSKDFMDAFELVGAKDILVFPNCSNSILTSMQAGSFYKKGRVTVLNSRSLAECYACLGVLDFESSVKDAVSIANSTISGIYQISVYHATKDVAFGSKKIKRNEFFALADKEIVAIGDTLANAGVTAIKDTLSTRDCGVITLFYGKYISSEYIEFLSRDLSLMCKGIDIATVATYDTACDLTIIFE